MIMQGIFKVILINLLSPFKHPIQKTAQQKTD